MKWVCLLMFGSVGLTMFAIGLVWAARRYALQRDGERAAGTVVELSESRSIQTKDGRSYESLAYYPVVEFAAADGKTRRFRGSTGSSAPSYEKGATVSVLYLRKDPSVAQIADFEQFWLGPLGIGLFGFLFLVAGIGGFFLIADSDRTFGPAFHARFARQELMEGKRGIALRAVVKEVRETKEDGQPRYTVVVEGGMPGAAPRDFTAAPLSFDPGSRVLGREVAVYADPDDADRYYVHLEPLLRP